MHVHKKQQATVYPLLQFYTTKLKPRIMRTTRLFCALSCLLSFSSLFASHTDTLVIISPAMDYGHYFETASFPGGTEALYEFITSNVNYSLGREEMASNKVVVSFAVGSDGQVFDILIDEGNSYEMEEDLIGAIKMLPKWKPAHFGEMPICMRMRLSIAFQ